MGSIAKLHIAVLVNHPPHTTFWPEVRNAFVDTFALVAPDAQVDLFDPIVERNYPNPNDYDLIILSGGKGNALSDDPWVLQQVEWVQNLVEQYPKKKLVGICLGHQLVVRALGGQGQDIPAGPIAGLVKINLTEEGRKFFPGLAEKGSYLASQFHVREVTKLPPGFLQLAENNEALVSASNTIFSIQAHPEIDGIFSKKILDDDDPTYVQRYGAAEVKNIKTRCTDPQDGPAIVSRIMEWIQE